ncbi:MAG: hypothetical protein Greene041662_696 [Candidatus Peregrinibacteria bacterium Greene0416_62]|nr:MAG: hypothetical protein Greene041662_696 [Candidatus Peregrinibacteria bacterium Greene0416_62]
MDDIQVTPKETAETDESPVESTDHDEDKTDFAAFTAARGATTHKEKGEKE